jgi:periplasmic divalent cation tolerance protein
MTDYLLVLSTCPDAETAQRLATILIERRLAACVNILPGVTSVYRWQGKITQDSEVLLLAKTRIDRYQEVETALVEHHPYELPEVVAVSLKQGLSDYLAWLDDTLDGGS